jgi:hypothetical protein
MMTNEETAFIRDHKAIITSILNKYLADITANAIDEEDDGKREKFRLLAKEIKSVIPIIDSYGKKKPKPLGEKSYTGI